jgi:type II secretory pathway predicted ATPase ExeA
MYCAHFGLQRRPFEVSTEPTQLFLDGSRAVFCDALLYVLEHEKGFVKITGAVGSGKTTLCRWLLRTLPAERYRIVHLADPTLSTQQLDFALSEGLGLECSREKPNRVRMRLETKLRSAQQQGQQVLVLVDEAHAMPLETLERLRLLGQGAGDGDNAVRMVLLGPPELDQRLAGSEFAALRDRIVHSLRLRRLNLDDIRDYLHSRLKAAGYGGPKVFSTNAVRLIGGLSRGLPRRINLLADKAMIAAALDNRFMVHTREVAAATREIRLEKQRAERPSGRLLSLAAGLGFAAGIVLTAGVMLTALHLGWLEGPTAEQAHRDTIATSSAGAGRQTR